MDELAARLRRERAIQALLPLFFLSGATALVYQTLWNRELHLVFGTSTFATSTVLAAYMAGLAAGGFLMARAADRIRRPLATYGALEILIGAYAVIFPLLVQAVTPVYLEVWRALQPGPVAFGLVQFSLVGVTLLLPTAAMGATLPILARFATERLGAAGDRVGTLYAVNTAGAVFGTWGAGFVLLPAVGLWATTLLAAGANLALGLGALALDRWARTGSGHAADDLTEEVGELHPELVPVATVMGLAGFASLVYEVAWTRLMGLMLGASVYAFSTMLLAFLTGIALGGKIGGPLADRILRWHGQRGVLQRLALVEVGVGLTSYLLMYLYPELPFWYVWLFDGFGAESDPSAMWILSTVLSALVMTPPAVLMGMAFPLAVRAVVTREDALGGPVGHVYAANTVGSMAGAFVAGFVLLPQIDVKGTIYVAAFANLLAAAVLLVRATRGRVGTAARLAPLGALSLGLLFVARQPPWDPLLMTAGMYQYVSHFEDHSREGIERYAVGKYDLLFYDEGLSTVVTVAKNRESDNIWLANNGKVDASTTTDMPTQVLCSLLPMQFAEQPKDVLVIGLASGITAGAVTLLDAVERLDIVELEPAIEQAARYFDAYNHAVLDDPRTRLVTNDGRNHLLLTPPGTYDVIVSEPSNPWITGVSNLFTREFFEMGKARLKPGGVWSQWVQMYGMDDHDLRSLLRTFASVYDHVLVYATIEESDLVLVGSDAPIRPRPELAFRLMEQPKVRKELRQVDVESPMELVAIFQFDRDRLMEVTEGAPLNTDDNMRIEYNAPRNLHRDTTGENFRFLLSSAVVPFDVLDGDVDATVELARTYQARGEVVRAVLTVADAVRRVGRDSPLGQWLIAEAERWQAELLAEAEGSGAD